MFGLEPDLKMDFQSLGSIRLTTWGLEVSIFGLFYDIGTCANIFGAK